MEYFNLAREAQFKKDYKKAIEFYTVGSNDDPACLFGLGLCYKKGYGVKKNDIKAEEIFERSLQKLQIKAFLNEANCSLVLYFMYSYGYGCNKDLAKAKMFLEMAVMANSVEAIYISCGLPERLAYASTNELVVALKEVTDINILQKLLKVISANDENSPLKYTLDALIYDLEYRQKVVFPKKEEADPFLTEINEILENPSETSSETELNMDWDSAFSSSPLIEDAYVETASDGLVHSLKTLGYVDLEYIARVTTLPIKEVIQRLKGSIYQDPNKWNECFYKGWVTADEYLSGNLLSRLKVAEEANRKYNGYFNENIEAIKKVLPEGVTSSEIYATIASSWIPEDIIKDFILDIMGVSNSSWHKDLISKDPKTNIWEIKPKIRNYNNNYSQFDYQYKTRNRSGLSILLSALNMKTVVVSKTDNRGNKYYDQADMLLAVEKQKILNMVFHDYIFNNEERKSRITEAYNSLYGYNVCRVYNGSFLDFKNMNPLVNLYDYQKNSIARIIFNKNTLLAHDVGTGKTYIMISSGEELIRMGLSKKNMYVVPNNILGQWADAYSYLYPNSKIKVCYPKDFAPNKRRKTLLDIKNNNYNAILLAHSSFDTLELSNTIRIKKLEDEFAEITNLPTISYVSEARLDEIENELSILREKEIDLNDDISFDKLGITRLYVDEAHYYKNVPIQTGLINMLGIASVGSTKCIGMVEKVSYMTSLADGGVIMATGTPITNSITDCYVFQRYLQEGELKLLNIHSFDNWVAMFAEKNEELEVDVDAKGYRMATRLSRFHNLPELTTILANVADFHRLEKNKDLPEFNGYKDIVLKKTFELSQYIEELSARSTLIRSGKVKRTVDNMLKVTTDGRLAALDLRLVDPNTKQNKIFSKVYSCAERVCDLYIKTNLTKATQLIFCDCSTPKEGFNIYDELKGALLMFGIKSSEIAFIHEAKTENQRQKLFDKVNSGEIRILIGSTFKLGLGVNVQKKLIAIHHLDVPWRPADMIQREGRIIRQGNENKEVFIYRYIQEASFDAYSWQLLETKQKFIDELLANSISVRSVLDVSDIVLNYGEVKALAIGNMRLRERFEIYNELNRLRLLHNNDQQLRSRYERELLEIPKKMEELEQLINDYTFDYAIYCSSRREYSGEERNEIRNYIYDEVLNNVMMKEERTLLSYQGFELILPMNMTEPKPYIWAVATHKHKIEMSNSASGCLIRIDNYLDNLNKKKKELEFEITLLKEKESSIRVTLERQIDYEPMIAELKMKLEKIDKELNG